VLDILQTTLAIVVALGVLVGVHEWGHFIVARLCGVKVQKFSIGFGQSLFSWFDDKGTEFVIAWIPLGGYVKMVDEREGEVKEEDLEYAFNRKPVVQRIAIVAAGPLINLFFATMVYWFVFMGGQEVMAPVVGSVAQESIAEQAGIMPGEEVIEVDGETMESWNDVVQNIVLKVLEPGHIEFLVKPAGSDQSYTRVVSLSEALKIDENTDPLLALGIRPEQPEVPVIIGDLVEGEAGKRDGLQVGDEVLAVNGEALNDWMDWVEIIKVHGGKPMQIELSRDDKLVNLEITPGTKTGGGGEQYGFIGAGAAPFEWPAHLVKKIEYNPLEALAAATKKTWDSSKLIIVSTWKLAIGDLASDNLGGPIMIANLAGRYADIGLLPYIMFVAYISIVLGVMNLLPIPVLDGGHILFYTIELIIGRPIPEKIQEVLMKAGLTCLLLIMGFAIYNDISRISTGS
jgi:regulator of sigma E protease